jgi:hypothetical protein
LPAADGSLRDALACMVVNELLLDDSHPSMLRYRAFSNEAHGQRVASATTHARRT